MDYHRVNKSISSDGSVQQLTMEVFENMLKIDSKTGKRKPITVKDERIFKKSFKNGKVAGITTVYRDKTLNTNGVGKEEYWIMKEIDGLQSTALRIFSITRVENDKECSVLTLKIEELIVAHFFAFWDLFLQSSAPYKKNS